MRNPVHVNQTFTFHNCMKNIEDTTSGVVPTLCVCVAAESAAVLRCRCCIARTSQVTVDLFPCNYGVG